MYALHPDKLVSVTRILARRRPPAPDGSNMVERLAQQLHAQQLSANPVAALGHDFRNKGVNWPKMPGPPTRTDGTVVIPGGKKRTPAIPKNKI